MEIKLDGKEVTMSIRQATGSDVGSQIRKFREIRHMTQKELGMKIGIDENNAQQYIHKYEKGKLILSFDVVVKIADALRLHVMIYPPNTVIFVPLP